MLLKMTLRYLCILFFSSFFKHVKKSSFLSACSPALSLIFWLWLRWHLRLFCRPACVLFRPSWPLVFYRWWWVFCRWRGRDWINQIVGSARSSMANLVAVHQNRSWPSSNWTGLYPYWAGSWQDYSCDCAPFARRTASLASEPPWWGFGYLDLVHLVWVVDNWNYGCLLIGCWHRGRDFEGRVSQLSCERAGLAIARFIECEVPAGLNWALAAGWWMLVAVESMLSYHWSSIVLQAGCRIQLQVPEVGLLAFQDCFEIASTDFESNSVSFDWLDWSAASVLDWHCCSFSTKELICS